MPQEKSQGKPLQNLSCSIFLKDNQVITAFRIITHEMAMNERFNSIGLNIDISWVFCEKTFVWKSSQRKIQESFNNAWRKKGIMWQFLEICIYFEQ